MTSLAVDTHKAVGALKAAGFEEAQAEAAVTTVGDAMAGDIATKAHVTAEVAGLRADMYRLALMTAVGVVGLTVVLVKFIP